MQEVLEHLAARLNPDICFSAFQLSIIADEVSPASISADHALRLRAPKLPRADDKAWHVQICSTYSKHYCEGRGLSVDGLCQVRMSSSCLSSQFLPATPFALLNDERSSVDAMLCSCTRITRAP